MKTKESKFTLTQGSNDNWFIKENKKVIAGFLSKDHADLFYSLILGKSDGGGALKATGLFDQIQKSGPSGIE